MIELINETLTRRSSGLGGCNRKVVGGSFWFVLSVVSAVPVEAPKPLNAGVGPMKQEILTKNFWGNTTKRKATIKIILISPRVFYSA